MHYAARFPIFCASAIIFLFEAGESKTKRRLKSQNATANQSQPEYPFFVHDTRFFNNFSSDRAGDPIKIWVTNADQYSRVLMSPRESLVFDELVSLLRSDDIVLDLGADVGVFSLTAARRGVSQVSKRGREGGREGRGMGGREGGWEGGRELLRGKIGRDGGKGGRIGGREGGWEGEREDGRERGRMGGREGGSG